MTGPSAPAPRRGGRPAVRRRPCDVPWLPHDLTYARPYPCGWRCDRHSPWALANQPKPGMHATTQIRPDPARQEART